MSKTIEFYLHSRWFRNEVLIIHKQNVIYIELMNFSDRFLLPVVDLSIDYR